MDYLASLFPLPPAAIEQGLEAKQPCRLEILGGPPLIILDVAHNPDGILHLFESINRRFPGKDLRLLFALSKSKDVSGCLKEMIPHGSHYHIVEASNGRSASKDDLSKQLQSFSVSPSSISLHPSVAAAVQIAREEALKQDQILVIFGTFFIMGEVRQALDFNEPFDPFDMNERNSGKKLSG